MLSCLFLLVRPVIIRADGCAEVTLKDTSLEVNRAPASAGRILLLQVLALGELPCLDTQEEEECGNEDNTPLPANATVPEHDRVDDGNVQHREDGDESAHDGKEEELVAPHIADPLREILLGSRLHPEKRAAHIQHLPR
jgi:hypothetical protein